MAPRCWRSCVAFLLSFTLAQAARAGAPGTPPAAPATAPGPISEPSGAPNVHEAQKHHDQAVARYDAGDLAGARRELELAYELAPNFRALFNLGAVSSELRDYAAAAEYFERYLAEGGANVSAERRAQVTAELADIMPRVAHVDVRVNVAGAEITVDERLAGVSPLRAPIRLNPGTHRVNARAAGWRSHGSVLELASGNRVTVELQLLRSAPEALEPPLPEAAAAPPEESRGSAPESSIPWLMWAGSAALAGAAVFSGVQALAKDSEYDSKREQLGITRAELDASRSSVQHWSIAADAFTAAAIVMSGVSLYLTLEPATGPGEQTRSAALGVRVSPAGLHVDGRF